MELSLLAMEGRHRVAIVSAAHRMNPDAQNALLKTLEEPGPGTCIILCADDIAPVLPTVLSRTAHLRLAPLPVERLTDLLVSRGAAPPPQARAIAIASGGRPGVALRLAGQPDAVLARARIVRTLIDLSARRSARPPRGEHGAPGRCDDRRRGAAGRRALVRGEPAGRRAPPGGPHGHRRVARRRARPGRRRDGWPARGARPRAPR